MGDWASPPVDEVGYLPATDLLAMGDAELRGLIENMRQARYGGWRNHEGRWRDLMGLDEGGRDVLDFGCGTGMEALELARAGNRVTLADIHPANLALAYRVLRLEGHEPEDVLFLYQDWQDPGRDGTFDTFHASGVLHHVRDPRPVMERAHALLRPGGGARLMLYSGEGWRIATGTAPPDDVAGHPDREKFVRFFDQVGDWADWYDEERLAARFGDLFAVERFGYLAPDRRFLGAVLRRLP